MRMLCVTPANPAAQPRRSIFSVQVLVICNRGINDGGTDAVNVVSRNQTFCDILLVLPLSLRPVNRGTSRLVNPPLAGAILVAAHFNSDERTASVDADVADDLAR